MKLIFGLPTAGNPTQPFLDSLKALRAPASVTEIERLVVTGNFVPGQRELIVRQAIEKNADFLLMLDDDMVLPRDTIELLYQSMQSNVGNAIVGALYYSRDGKRPMAVSNWRADDTTDATVPAFSSDSAVRIGGIGFGCVLLRMAAFEKLQRPYFSTQIVVESAHSHVRICNEDYLLCSRFIDAGLHVMLDARVRCGHYDRDQAKIFPLAWEPDEITSVERMHVRSAQNVDELVPYVRGMRHDIELHEHGVLDYLFIS